MSSGPPRPPPYVRPPTHRGPPRRAPRARAGRSADGEAAAAHGDLLRRQAGGRRTRDDVTGGEGEVTLVARAHELVALQRGHRTPLVRARGVEGLERAGPGLRHDGVGVGEEL